MFTTNDLLIVIDMQNDFIDGALGTKEAAAIVDAVAERIRRHNGTVFYTLDTHGDDYLQTQEGHYLPVVHCLKGTDGWQIAGALRPWADSAPVFDKPAFGSPALAHWCSGQQPDSITLCGVCTGICVISNALLIKAALPETPVRVLAHCCACVTPQSHQTALDAMRLCQVEIVE